MPPISFRISRLSANYAAKLRHLPARAQVPSRLQEGFPTSMPNLASTARFSPVNALAAYSHPGAEARTPYLLMPWEGVTMLGPRLHISIPQCPSPEAKKAYALALQNNIITLASYPHTATLYSDSAAWTSDGRRLTGWGWMLTLGDSKLESGFGALGTNCTSYDAEAHGLLQGVRALVRTCQQHEVHAIHIVADNAGLLKALLARKPVGSPSAIDGAVRDLWDLLQARLDTDLRISWCPAHSRIPGNERADRLSKRGALLNPVCPFHISTNYIRLRAARRLLSDWRDHWRGFQASHPRSIGAEALMNSPRLKLHPVHNNPGKRRTHHAQLIRAITGHGRHASYLFNCGKADSPNCRCGAAKQDVRHIFRECPRHEQARAFLRGFSQQLDLSRIFSTVRGLKAALEFLAVGGVDI